MMNHLQIVGLTYGFTRAVAVAMHHAPRKPLIPMHVVNFGAATLGHVSSSTRSSSFSRAPTRLVIRFTRSGRRRRSRSARLVRRGEGDWCAVTNVALA